MSLFSIGVISACLPVLWSLWQRGKYSAIVLPIFYLVSIFYTYFGLYVYEYAMLVPFDFYSEVAPQDISLAFDALSIAMISFSLGALVVSGKGARASRLNASNVGVLKVGFGLIVLALLSPVLAFLSMPFDEIFIRNQYDTENVQILKTLADVMTPLAVAIAVMVRRRPLKFILLLAIFLPYFSMGSRMILVFPVIYLFIKIIQGERLGVWRSCWLLIVTLILVGLSLQLRRSESHGLFGYVVELYSSGLSVQSIFISLNYVFSYSVSLLALMMAKFDFNTAEFFYSISPVPSFISGGGASGRVNDHVPFSAIGQLALGGSWLIAGYFFFAGGVLAHCEKYFAKKNRVLVFLPVVISLLLTITSVQYNLRATTRILLYLVLLYIVTYFFRAGFQAYKTLRVKGG